MSQSNLPPFDDLNLSESSSNTLESEQNREDLQAITPKRNNVVTSGDKLNQTRSELATGLLWLSIGISAGIALLVSVDLGISKFIAWRLIEKLSEPTLPVSSQQTGASSQPAANPAQPSPNSPDKSSDAAQKLIVYKDLLKEASLNKELLTLLLTSQTALVSGALGFYFGGKDNN